MVIVMLLKIFQKGFNFSQDGPGNRLVYHLSGCNMRCPWCSNPEGMSGNAGKDFTPQEILDECLRSKPMFFNGDGVTFTGGEATLQEEALIQTLKLLKKAKIHTALETNGTSKKMSEISPLISYMIMDFKHYDSDKLKSFTGIGNETIKSNFEWLCKKRHQLHIRIPLINGFNNTSPEKFAEYFALCGTKRVNFEFLPYHEYGKDKWTTPYTITDGFVSEQTVENFRQVFAEHGLNLINT